MLSKRQKDIISSLQLESDWIKGTALAAKVNVTSRTIRNDVNSINYEHANLIESSPQGYRLNPQITLSPSIYQSSKYAGRDERLAYVLGKLLSQEGRLDLYDLSDELFVSLQTLEKDTAYLDQKLKEFQLKLNKKANYISVSGGEYDKRRMLSHLVYSELNEKFHDLVTYREYFEDVELYSIKSLLYEVMSSHQVSANEYSVNAIVLHLGIAISRVKNNKIIHNEEYSKLFIEDSADYELASQIAFRVMDELGIKLPEEEIQYLAFILFGKIRPDYMTLTIDNLAEHVEKEYTDMVSELLDDINKTYGLHFYGNEVFIRFVVHVKNLLIRAKNNVSTKNPLSETIKHSYPLIYDVAVFITDRLHTKTGYTIDEDEIAYLAIHVGACLETTSSKSRLRTLLYCPQYYNIHGSILARLLKHLEDKITIVGVESHISPGVINDELDLILTTAELLLDTDTFAGEIIVVPPFPKDHDIRKIETAIKKIKEKQRKSEFACMARESIQKELFVQTDQCSNEWEAIDILAGKMFSEGYVGPNFAADVQKRERLSSTTFGGGFAIPHSIHMDAIKTSIAVMITDKPFSWGNFSVSLILMIAVNERDASRFADFYEELIGLLLNEENLKLLHQVKSYEEFLEGINKMLFNHL